MSSGKNNFSIETTCIRRVMTGLTSKEYNFTEIDVMELTNIGDNYTGIFIYNRKNLNHNMHPPTSMNVYESGRTKADYQTTLEYTEPDTYSCSVFTVYFMSNKITDVLALKVKVPLLSLFLHSEWHNMKREQLLCDQ
ncbi:uncharacterized protein LOC142761732 isoform X2 [Rhipicephalus microplus]|uniref:uncharacterized protein LOC142761732 isoform X2 n=1 Tax=Rhipicephalus microplus TaxID=6941 RepID=UPI003F6BD1D3